MMHPSAASRGFSIWSLGRLERLDGPRPCLDLAETPYVSYQNPKKVLFLRRMLFERGVS